MARLQRLARLLGLLTRLLMACQQSALPVVAGKVAARAALRRQAEADVQLLLGASQGHTLVPVVQLLERPPVPEG